MIHELSVNGDPVEVEVRGLETLADVLRSQAGLTGTKVACGRGECGACTVLVGGRPTMSCILPVVTVVEPVQTIEGVADEISDLREEFADRGAFQCGFCTPGQLVRATALLRAGETSDGTPLGDDPAALRHDVSGNLCRCTGYQAINAAICSVAQRRREASTCGADR